MAARVVGACVETGARTGGRGLIALGSGSAGRVCWGAVTRFRIFRAGIALGALGFALCVLPSSAAAQGKPKAHPVAPRKPQKKAAKKPEPEVEKSDDGSAGDTTPSDDKATEKPDKGEPSAVKAAGTSATKATPQTGANAATVKEDKSGVKTYKFGTVEVEGRMKSPQIIYFMRRVRAEFDAGLLGHRSFMRELSDTRNNSSFR